MECLFKRKYNKCKAFHNATAFRAMATEIGIQYGTLIDRFFSTRSEATGNKINAIQCPTLVNIEVEMGPTKSEFIFTAPGMIPLALDISKCTEECQIDVFGTIVDCIDGEDEAADWLSEYLGVRCRLSLQPTDRDVKVSNPGFDQINWRLGKINNFKTKVSFANRYPYNLLGVDSVRDMNDKIPGKSLTHRYFRPNLVVQATNQIPWDEDNWIGELHIGEAIFAVAAQRPCW